MINSRVGRSSQTMYGYKADVWALGVILFEMVFGFRPLQGLGDKESKISFLGQIQADIPIPAHPDKQLRDILKQCLRSNPRRRPTIEQVLNHSFLTRTQWWRRLELNFFDIPSLPSLSLSKLLLSPSQMIYVLFATWLVRRSICTCSMRA